MVSVAPAWVKLNRAQMEARRLAAAKDLLAGVSQVEVARKYGVKPPSVNVWKRRLEQEGIDGLRLRPKSGRPTKLSKADGERLVKALLASPRAAGFQTDVWTGPQVKRFVAAKFGVDFHEKSVPRVLRDLGFRLRMPDREAIEKDPARKAEWLREAWPQAKKNSPTAKRSSSSTKPHTR